MTLWQDPPQTRRQARENERSAEQKAAGQASRRAGTAEPTPGGEIPIVTTPYTFSAGKAVESDEAQQPAIPATAFEEPGVTSPTRPNLPSYGASFDALLSPRSTDDDGSDDGKPSEPASALYHQAPEPGAVEPVTTPVAVVPPTATPSGQPERILTRRELRAMQQAQEANQQAGHVESVVPITFTQPEESKSTTPAAPKQDAPAEPAADVSSSNAGAWPFAPLVPSAAPAAATPPAAPAAAPSPAPTERVEESTGEKQPYQPPVGHWSTAAELDDKNQPFDQIISRSVGPSGAATTTNALILPVLPTADATGPLTSTGEILVTGSIDLPRGLGSTGAHPDRIDSSDIDRLLDGEENEFNTSEVAPIRASRAVSTHTSTRGVITPPKKRGGRLPVILMITAGVLAVGVIGLLVAAYVLNVF
ncbi:hypothetical protein ACFVWR_16565 [Leifsonia sp. NPDC058292]|uniref:hypothetical protein n=1 Tax=Leifsonia sp. NPDC058292 TaxID=3346428 RepID=UPI0036DEDFE4